MIQSDRMTMVPCHRPANLAISRRSVLASSSMSVLGLLSGSAEGEAATEARESQANTPGTQPPKQVQERLEQSRVFAERMRDAESMEERQQIMHEQMAWQRQRAVDDLQEQLRLSEREWSVVKPRLQAVYDLVHPRAQMMGRSEPPKTEVEQRRQELRELLRDEKAEAGQIKAKLTALRAAKERAMQQLINARQGLRQLLTLRQEALLVLNGLLD